MTIFFFLFSCKEEVELPISQGTTPIKSIDHMKTSHVVLEWIDIDSMEFKAIKNGILSKRINLHEASAHYYASMDFNKNNLLAIDELAVPKQTFSNHLESSFNTYLYDIISINEKLKGIVWLQIDGQNFTRHILSVIDTENLAIYRKPVFLSEHQGDAGYDYFLESWFLKEETSEIYSVSCEMYENDSSTTIEKKGNSFRVRKFIDNRLETDTISNDAFHSKPFVNRLSPNSCI